LPLIVPEIERQLHRCIESQARDQGCIVLALNGTSDHIHLVVSLPTTLNIAELVKQVKGASSHLVNNELAPDTQFKWQGSYGAFTVSRWDLDKIIQYVKGQKEHHAASDLWLEWEETFEEIVKPVPDTPSA
jgi:REP element-mobilizing transposase RayT